jgi:hypothetical protein
MIINTDKIAKLSPCESRFNNYLTHYKDFEGSLEEFLALDKINYTDKVWVFTRLATKGQNIKWAVVCARSVLDIFESKYPDDKRPRMALDAALDYSDGKISLDELLEARRGAYTAAYAAADADAAAYYAADAAADAAAASYAAYAAPAAANAAANAAASSREQQEELNLSLMLEAVR